ncbi:MAG: DM13 domain-containing protein [Patescibacteria group bacterium]|nr:DM13 domain-containing protein [Patescibacteria group bacterium]
MTKKIVLGISIVIIIVVAYWLISPLFINNIVDESLEDIAMTPINTKSIPTATTTSTPTQENTAVISEKTPITPVIQETTPKNGVLETLAKGTFIGLAGHNAEGTATLLKIGTTHYIRFEGDFKVTNGPDVFVYLGKNGSYAPEAQLAALKGNIGSQNYEIPDTIDITDYNEVWIWCRAFSVPFGSAVLR